MVIVHLPVTQAAAYGREPSRPFHHTAQATVPTPDGENLQVVLDKAYNDEEQELRLWREQDILLLPLCRKNMKTQWEHEVKAILKRVRLRVETALSISTRVWNIEWPRARSLSGIIARIATRILAHTVSFIVAPKLLPMKTSRVFLKPASDESDQVPDEGNNQGQHTKEYYQCSNGHQDAVLYHHKSRSGRDYCGHTIPDLEGDNADHDQGNTDEQSVTFHANASEKDFQKRTIHT